MTNNGSPEIVSKFIVGLKHPKIKIFFFLIPFTQKPKSPGEQIFFSYCPTMLVGTWVVLFFKILEYITCMPDASSCKIWHQHESVWTCGTICLARPCTAHNVYTGAYICMPLGNNYAPAFNLLDFNWVKFELIWDCFQVRVEFQNCSTRGISKLFQEFIKVLSSVYQWLFNIIQQCFNCISRLFLSLSQYLAIFNELVCFGLL